MNAHRLLPLSAVLVLCTSGALLPSAAQDPATGQATPAAETQPKAEEVVQRYLAVCKLDKALAEHRSLSVSGSLEIVGKDTRGTMRALKARPDLFVQQIRIVGLGDTRIGFDGEIAWMQSPIYGDQILDGAMRAQSVAENLFDPSLGADGPYESAATVGRETFEGKDCWKLRYVLKPWDGADPAESLIYRESFEYYEVASGLLVGRTQVGATPAGPQAAANIVLEHKELAGVLLPTRSIQRVGSEQILTIIDAASWDQTAESAFALPASVGELVKKRAAKAKAEKQPEGGK